MPSGQSSTTWFPELKNILEQEWTFNPNIDEHFKLVEKLNKQLKRVRLELNVKTRTFWCHNCNERHESEFSSVTITSLYFALERFGHCTHKEHLELKRNWRKHSKENSVNIYGNQITKNESREDNKVS